MERPQAHLAGSSVDHIAKDPGLSVEGADLEIKPEAVAKESSLARGANRSGTEFVAFSSHRDSKLIRSNLRTKMGRMQSNVNGHVWTVHKI
jgi:hypothetical protein